MAQHGDFRRPNSCGGAPGKIVKGMPKRSMHVLRIVRCQDPLAPALEFRCRRPAVLGCNLQRPAEMLARVTQSHAQPVVPANLFIEDADMVELLGKRWRGFNHSCLEAASDLA